MKTITAGIVILGLTFINSPAWSTGFDTQAVNTDSRSVMQALSADEHLKLADAAKESFENLETQIEQVQARIDTFTRKPHLDTKGFKRQGLRLWRGKLVNEAREAAQKVVWHETQAQELLALQKSDHSQQDS